MHKLYAVAAPGLAPITEYELSTLGLASAAPANPQAPRKQDAGDPGGVAFTGDLEAIYRANLWLRTASRVLVRLGEFRAIGFTELRRAAAKLAWERYLVPGQPVTLRVTCHKSRLYHSDAVAERVVGAIGDRLSTPPAVEKADEEADQPPQIVLVRLLHDQCTISIDASGALLHRRGYRLATAKAPLRETLAAGILFASGWAEGALAEPAPLLDPFCGSGTIPIEAALLACNAAPGRHRRFAFMEWPGFDVALWQSLLIEADRLERDRRAALGGKLVIQGSDRDAGAIEAAEANAGRAHVAEFIEFQHHALSSIIPPPTPGWVVTNPPYGQRLSTDQDLRNLYAQFGNVMRAKCPGWQVAMLCSDVQLVRQTGLALDAGLGLVNGGLSVRLATGIVHRT
ncbi:MAG: hypothetical protein IPK16_15280 [Anaerolineales bacterium]|nr:hypothetical protein [Anaerolineales bacterium]